MIHDYETMTSDLLEWIQKTITTLNDRQFANSLAGVQQQLATFNGYRTVEKPPKYVLHSSLIYNHRYRYESLWTLVAYFGE